MEILRCEHPRIDRSCAITRGEPGLLDPGVVGLEESKTTSTLSKMDEDLCNDRGELGTDDAAKEPPV
jgi:hypothetical protein